MSTRSRAAVAAAVALTMCGVGYLALVMSIHGSTPLLSVLRWCGLPIFSLADESSTDHSESFYLMTVAVGAGLWFITVFMLLPRKHTIPDGGTP